MQDNRTIIITLSNRWIRRLVTTAAVLALVVPAAAWAADTFTDVPASNVFHDDIEWMADNGVTKGCNPPENTEYCPDENVTREQMAAFMHRLETEGVFLPGDGKAVDANKLDGLDSTDLLPRFAVIEYNLGSAALEASRGLTDWTRESAGQYLLTFDRDVTGCAWTSAAGARNNAVWGTDTFYTVSLHSAASGDDRIRVQIKDENGTAEDRTFNVAISC